MPTIKFAACRLPAQRERSQSGQQQVKYYHRFASDAFHQKCRAKVSRNLRQRDDYDIPKRIDH